MRFSILRKIVFVCRGKIITNMVPYQDDYFLQGRFAFRFDRWFGGLAYACFT